MTIPRLFCIEAWPKDTDPGLKVTFGRGDALGKSDTVVVNVVEEK